MRSDRRITTPVNRQPIQPQRGYGQSFEGLPGLAIGGGVDDALTDIMVTGGRSDIPGGPPPPPMGGPPMGGPPMGGPPMGGPPMGGPAAAETLMANADMLQGDMQRPPMEGAGGGGIEQDAMALADAVVGRAEGDINAALAILDGATQILITSGEQEQPLMAAGGSPITNPPGTLTSSPTPRAPSPLTPQDLAQGALSSYQAQPKKQRGYGQAQEGRGGYAIGGEITAEEAMRRLQEFRS